VYAVTEHWGNNNIENTSSHTWFGIDKPTDDGMYGGVGAFVHNKFANLTNILWEYSDHNLMWLRIVTNDTPLFVAVVYSNPKDNILLQNILNRIKDKYSLLSNLGKVLIMGDFNCRLGRLTRDKTLDNTRANILKDFLYDTSTRPVVNTQDNHWTCYKNGGTSVNDLFISSKSDLAKIKHYKVHKQHMFGSDHTLLTCEWQIKVTLQTTSQWSSSALTEVDWDNEETVTNYTIKLNPLLLAWKSKYTTINCINESNNATNKLVSLIQTALKEIRTEKSFKGKTAHKEPPRTKHIDELISHRNAHLQTLHTSDDAIERGLLSNIIHDLQNRIASETSIMKDKKVKLVWDDILEHKTNRNLDTYWKMVSKLRKNKDSMGPNLLVDKNGDHITDKLGIVNIFAQRYASVATGSDDEAKSFKSNNSNLYGSRSHLNAKKNVSLTYQKALNSVSTNENPHLAFNTDLTLNEIETVLRNFKRNKAPGDTKIPTEALSKGGDLLTSCLLILYQSWWSMGHTPAKMQMSSVSPVYKKKGDKSNPKSYRPISLLNSIFKGYEKLLESRLRTYAEQNGVISELQMGALNNLGTSEAIFQLLSAISHNKNNGKPVYMTILDLSKAYDRVWRDGLWAKLWTVGIKGKLLGALLSTYKQPQSKVRVGDFTSDTFLNKEGLRQGSVLSPLLFVILFSDVVKALDSNSGIPLPGLGSLHCQLFVDDTVLLTDNEDAIARQLDRFNAFAILWGSVLNIDKTVILSTTKLKNEDDWLENYLLLDAPNNTAQYLGLWLTLKNDTWNQHFDRTIAKARKAFYHLKSLGLRKECMPATESVSLFKLLILPKLTFALDVIIPSEAVIRKVDNFIGFCVKQLLGIPYSAPTITALWEANILSFGLQTELAHLRFHWKLIQGPRSHRFSSLYTQGNFLYNWNMTLCVKWNVSCDKPAIVGKYSWKSKLSKHCTPVRVALLSEYCPGFLCLKPDPNPVSTVLALTDCFQLAIMRARHSLASPSKCTHCYSLTMNHAFHLLMECNDSTVFPGRVALTIGLKLSCPSIQNSTPIFLFRTLIGGPSPDGHVTADFLKTVCSHLITYGLSLEIGHQSLT
jgi:hypothetical protein